MNQSSQRPWLTWRKVVCVGLLFLVAGYVAARPTLEQWLGVELPSLMDEDRPAGPERDKAAGEPDLNTGGNQESYLSPLSGSRLESPAGLIYPMGPRDEHRLDHVMRHARDDPNRPIHGVFDGDREQILRWIDQAYRLSKQESDRVTVDREGNRTELSVDLGVRIGYVGGRAGKRQGYPESQRLKLILDGNQVITAYPF